MFLTFKWFSHEQSLIMELYCETLSFRFIDLAVSISNESCSPTLQLYTEHKGYVLQLYSATLSSLDEFESRWEEPRNTLSSYIYASSSVLKSFYRIPYELWKWSGPWTLYHQNQVKCEVEKDIIVDWCSLSRTSCQNSSLYTLKVKIFWDTFCNTFQDVNYSSLIHKLYILAWPAPH